MKRMIILALTFVILFGNGFISHAEGNDERDRRKDSDTEKPLEIEMEEREIHHILHRRDKRRSLQGTERIRLQKNRLSYPEQNRRAQHAPQNRAPESSDTQEQNDKQADKHGNNIQNHMGVSAAHLLPSNRWGQRSEEVSHHIEGTSGFRKDPSIRSQSDLQEHQADRRGDAKPDRERDRLNDLRTDIQNRQNQEHDSFDQDDTQCRLVRFNIGHPRNSRHIRDNHSEKAVQSHTGSHDKRLVRKKSHRNRSDGRGDAGCHEYRIPQVSAFRLVARKNIRIQRNDIRHGDKRGQPRKNLGSDICLVFLQMKKSFHTISSPQFRYPVYTGCSYHSVYHKSTEIQPLSFQPARSVLE